VSQQFQNWLHAVSDCSEQFMNQQQPTCAAVVRENAPEQQAI